MSDVETVLNTEVERILFTLLEEILADGHISSLNRSKNWTKPSNPPNKVPDKISSKKVFKIKNLKKFQDLRNRK